MTNGGRGIRTPMSLAARWISSPLPYQLGLALHELKAGVLRSTLFRQFGYRKTCRTCFRLRHSALRQPPAYDLACKAHKIIALTDACVLPALPHHQDSLCHDRLTREGMMWRTECQVCDPCFSDNCDKHPIGIAAESRLPIAKDRPCSLDKCTVL